MEILKIECEIPDSGDHGELKVLIVESALNADLGSNNLEIPMTFEQYLNENLNDT